MYVEITGLSGAGKSTFTGRLLDRLPVGSNFVTNYENRFSFANLKQPTAQNLYLDARATLSLVRKGTWLSEVQFAREMLLHNSQAGFQSWNLVRAYLRKRGSYEFLRRMPSSRVALIDEGLVHGAYNLLVHESAAPREELIDRYLQHIPSPDRIILVRAPLNTVLERSRQRHDKPRRLKTNADLERFTRNAWAMFEVLESHPKLKGRTTVVEDIGDGVDEKIFGEVIKQICGD